jgi:hypothetical protein
VEELPFLLSISLLLAVVAVGQAQTMAAYVAVVAAVLVAIAPM